MADAAADAASVSVFPPGARSARFGREGFEDVRVDTAYKTLSIDYLINQIKPLNPVLSRALGAVTRVVPASVLRKYRRINIGEMLAVGSPFLSCDARAHLPDETAAPPGTRPRRSALSDLPLRRAELRVHRRRLSGLPMRALHAAVSQSAARRTPTRRPVDDRRIRR